MKNKLKILLVFLLVSEALFAQENGYIKSNIYAIVVGIGNYKDNNIPNLKFPEKDATAFYNFLKSPHAGSIPEMNMALLTGTNATRIVILKQVQDIFSRSTKNDMIIFYFSGHGKAGFNESGFLLPYDDDFENDLGTAIPMSQLNTIIESFPAKMKVSYIDACHAGLFSSNGKGGMEDDNAIIAKAYHDILLKSEKGSVHFLASTARQQSLEDDKLQHGVFTYFLLKGLNGDADKSQPDMSTYDDGMVNISELNTYLTDSISHFTKYKQKPSVGGIYNDQFPLSILKINVPLTSLISKMQSDTKTKNQQNNQDNNFTGNKLNKSDTANVLNNNQSLKCSKCNGKGTFQVQGICTNCAGTGKVACSVCSGKGGEPCASCHGTGIWPMSLSWGNGQPCTNCSGKGKISVCKSCKGKGDVICDICKGKKIAITEEICPVCKGKGEIKKMP